MPTKLLSPIRITDMQRKWLEDEKKRTGNTIAVLIRNLIQDKLTADENAINRAVSGV